MKNKYKKLIIYTDGGARGNPGPAGCGVIFYNENKDVVAEISKFIGHATNNYAEYMAVVFAFEKAKDLGAEYLDFYLDSELVVKQLNREYKVKNKELASLFVKIYNNTLNFKEVKFFHIRREFNKEADRLANLAMDQAINK